MKISELIAVLGEIKEEHGDLPVALDQAEGIKQIDFLQVWAFNLDAVSKYTLVLF